MSDKNIYNNKKAKKENNYSSEKKEYKNEKNIGNEEENDKEEEKNIYNIKIGKMTFADFFRNIYMKKGIKYLEINQILLFNCIYNIYFKLFIKPKKKNLLYSNNL